MSDPVSDRTPLIVRIAGLDSSVLEPFSTSLADPIEALLATEDELESVRSRLVDRLFERVPETEPEARRLLLAVKRDAHNGRPLGKYPGDPHWPTLLREAGAEVVAVRKLEDQRDEQIAALHTAYTEHLHLHRRHLVSFLDDPELLRGIALGSPGLVENLGRLRKRPVERFRRKERSLEASLLRYLSRTALKLSPFSTLSRVAMCEATDEDDRSGARLAGVRLRSVPWRAHSLSRMKRSFLDQISDLLAKYPPFREQSTVEVNDTVETVETERYRFLRPGFWEVGEEESPPKKDRKDGEEGDEEDRDEEDGKDDGEQEGSEQVVYRKPSLVQVSLRGPLIDWFLERLPGRKASYREVLSELAEDFPNADPETLRTLLEKFLQIGFLVLQMPWTSDDLHLEIRMLEQLDSMADPALRPVVDKLREIVELEATYPTTTSPARSVRTSQKLTDEIWHTVAPLGGVPPETRYEEPRRTYFHEDVLLTPEDDAERGILQASKSQLQEVLNDLAPVIRLANLCDRRWDFLLSLSAFAAQRWPDRSNVGFLDFFDAARPLWQELTKFEADARREKKPRWTVFDPMDRPEIQRLGEDRRAALEELPDCLRTEGEDRYLDLDRIKRLADRSPAPYSSLRDVCLFLQPADRTGDLWVLNEMFEGGRYHSRYTAVMPDAMREVFLQRYIRCSQGRQEGPLAGGDASGELLDILIPGGQTINLHAAQTPRMLEVPGQPSSLPPERVVRLKDLRVQLHGAGNLPWLSDLAGRPLLPIYMGTTILLYMPLLLKFLTTFGVSRLAPSLFPPHSPEKREEVTPRGRLYAGRVVLKRRGWLFSPADLLRRFEGRSDPEVFEALHRWRIRHEIPQRVFLARRSGKNVMEGDYKPQYFDFGSPLFVSLFLSHLDETMEQMTLEEILPGPEAQPRDRQDRPWAVELQVDSLVL